MNGYNRCCGYKAPMCGMPVMTQPVPVKMEAAPTKETCETTVSAQPMQPVYAPMMPAPMCGPVQFESCCRVVEPTVCCTPEVHHHHRVEHIVPVVVRNVHHHHNHHDYVICKQEATEAHQYDHGLRNEDWCSLAMQEQNSCAPKTPLC